VHNNLIPTYDNDKFIKELKQSLKKREKANTFTPDVTIVNTIVDDLCKNQPLKVTAKKISSNDSEKIILDVIATFGTWLTHSEGKLNNSSNSEEDFQILPQGYEPNSNHKRDITKALLRIRNAKPSSETISRFVARTYKTRSANLDHSLMAGVWGFAKRGRLSLIENVSDDPVFLSQVCEAYDLIVDTIKNAEKSLKFIVNAANSSSIDLAKLGDHVQVCKWLSEYEMDELNSYIDLAKINAFNLKPLREHLKKFAKRVSSWPEIFYITNIGNLTAGQIKRICELNGIEVESTASKRAFELQIRQNLKSLGLSNDQDILLPDALRAAEAGKLDEFWLILQARVDGDSTWSDQLEELKI